MRLWDAAGYLASGLVVMAFCMKDMNLLRLVVLGGNIAFLIYGVGLSLMPVCLLHATLLPINGWWLLRGISRRCMQTGAITKCDAANVKDFTGTILKNYDRGAGPHSFRQLPRRSSRDAWPPAAQRI